MILAALFMNKNFRKWQLIWQTAAQHFLFLHNLVGLGNLQVCTSDTIFHIWNTLLLGNFLSQKAFSKIFVVRYSEIQQLSYLWTKLPACYQSMMHIKTTNLILEYCRLLKKEPKPNKENLKTYTRTIFSCYLKKKICVEGLPDRLAVNICCFFLCAFSFILLAILFQKVNKKIWFFFQSGGLRIRKVFNWYAF